MALKAKLPKDVKLGKPKFLISGRSGVGKSTFALDFPKPYLIDTEGGAVRKQYQEKLLAVGGAYMGKDEGSQDFKIVINEIKALATEKHEYKTLIIDSFTKLYLLEAAAAEERCGSDFGKDKKEANKPTRQLLRWLEKLDMTVILICHAKDKWVRHGKEIVCEGTTFDGWEKMEFDLDLWIELIKQDEKRFFIVRKTRVSTLPEGNSYALDYDKFSELYGKDVFNEKVNSIVLASKEQIEELKLLLDNVKVDTDWIEKCMAKADAAEYSDLTSEQIEKLITFLKGKIKL